MSEDGRFWWDGTQWLAVPTTVAPPPPPPPASPSWGLASQAPLGAPAPAQYPAAYGGTQPPAPVPPPRRSSGVLVAMLAALVVVIGAAVAVFLVTRSSSGSSGLASETPSQILQASLTAVKNVSGYEMTGTGDFGSGLTSIDFKVHGKDIAGTGVINGSTIGIDLIGENFYFNAPAVFWTAEGAAADVSTELAGVWVKIPETSSSSSDFTSFSSLADISSLLQTGDTLAPGGTGTVDGRSVVFVKDSTSPGTLAVATSGPAYPVQLNRTGSSESGTISFSNWNSIPTLTPPPNPLTVPGS